jgi:hypothetical protein
VICRSSSLIDTQELYQHTAAVNGKGFSHQGTGCGAATGLAVSLGIRPAGMFADEGHPA